VATPQNPKQVTVSARSLEDVLEAIKNVAEAIAANTAAISASGGDGGNGGGGRGSGNGSDPTVRQPSDTQSRSIVDYLVVSQLMSRLGFEGRVVQARREGGKVVRLRNVPTAIDNNPVFPKKALVTPRAGAAETTDLQDSSDPESPETATTDPSLKFLTLKNIQDDQEIVRIELQDKDGVPLALGPRLAPLTSGFGGGGGTPTDVGGK
jgi:hypothetical protein